MTYYDVIIGPEDPDYEDSILITKVWGYKFVGSSTFYVTGADFEKWFVLRDGQVVSVTKETKDG